MPRLVRLQEIDQFADVVRIPEEAVSADVLRGVRQLDERRELEPALQEILFDPNDTPHGPTEIVDVLTSRLLVQGNRRMAGFVLKGRSFPRVSSRQVVHQFAKLRTVPDLGLVALVAVGDIQDDAHRDFVQMAVDADTDYIIVDAVDCARLLIAYEKICPLDGLVFGVDRSCGNGHHLDPGAKLEIPVRGDLYFEILRLEDLSHPGAKRYSAVVMVDRHASREILRKIIGDCVPLVRSEEHHSPQVGRQWAHVDAHVVWLYLAGTMEDARHSNWIARAEWIDAELDPGMRPFPLGGDESQEGVAIKWNEQYESMRQFYRAHSGAKGQLYQAIKALVAESIPQADEVGKALSRLDAGSHTSEEFDSVMREIHEPINHVVTRGVDLPFPPEDLKELDTAAQGLFSSLSNLAIYHSDLGKERWDSATRINLVRMALHDFRKDLDRVNDELSRIR